MQRNRAANEEETTLLMIWVIHRLVLRLIYEGLSTNKQTKKKQKQGRGSPTMWHWNNRMSIYFVIYLSVAGFTINSFLSPFIKNIIIGSSAFHNYDSYTVEMTKAASARGSVHVDWRPAPIRTMSFVFVFLMEPTLDWTDHKHLQTLTVSLVVPVLWYMYTSHRTPLSGAVSSIM